MISAINLNRKATDSIKPIQPREQLLIRLCALLHDFVNIPFGHTLENEGGLVPRDWKDTRRVDLLLNDSSMMGKLIVSFIDKNVGGRKGADFLKELRQVLTAYEESEIEQLAHPYVADIVSNTICADLLDYLKRDRYYCGLKEDYDMDRILNYVVLADYRGKERMAIRLWTEKQRMKRDILSELIDLLRLRYSLAEKVYFHHAKMAASAMLIRAIDDSGIVQTSLEKLLKYGDDQLLNLQSHVQTAADILHCLRQRALYQPVYQISYVKRGAGANVPERIRDVALRFHQPSERRSLEQKLEGLDSLRALGMRKGSVIVYCPAIEMNMKVATAKVIWQDSKVYPLNTIPDQDICNEVQFIEENHRKLWRMLVLLHPSVYEAASSSDVLAYIGSICEAEIGLPNDLPFKLSPLAQRAIEHESPLERLNTLDRLRQYAVANPLMALKDSEMIRLIDTIAVKAERDAKGAALTDEQIEDMLTSLRKSRQSES
jgi:hypothetical protein